MTSVGIVGANGYTGIELIRLLDTHPCVQISRLFSNATAGQTIDSIYPYLKQKYPLSLEKFDANQVDGLDVLFLALPHGQSHAYMQGLYDTAHLKIIDLSADYRIQDVARYESTYQVTHQSPLLISQIPLGFPEINRAKIAKAKAVANPGCYSTSVILGLYPLAKQGLIQSVVVVDSKSGVSGAGRSLKDTSLFCEANEAISAYQTGTHRHTAEMEETLGVSVLFSPHLSPMNRGILSCMYVDNVAGISEDQLHQLYFEYAKNEPFIQYDPTISMPSTKWVKGTNNLMITGKIIKDKIIIFSALDNLIKGASGQAIQNMNIMCGFEETAGLSQLAPYL